MDETPHEKISKKLETLKSSLVISLLPEDHISKTLVTEEYQFQNIIP